MKFPITNPFLVAFPAMLLKITQKHNAGMSYFCEAPVGSMKRKYESTQIHQRQFKGHLRDAVYITV